MNWWHVAAYVVTGLLVYATGRLHGINQGSAQAYARAAESLRKVHRIHHVAGLSPISVGNFVAHLEVLAAVWRGEKLPPEFEQEAGDE
jgi:hypothetical protein